MCWAVVMQSSELKSLLCCFVSFIQSLMCLQKLYTHCFLLFYRYNSFYVLLFSRMATGCSEAAFQVVAPPIIQDRGGLHAGLWLSIYLTGLPLGLAFGYVYGSNMAGSDKFGWDWAYYFICIASLPLLVVLSFVKDDTILGGDSIDADLNKSEEKEDNEKDVDETYGLTAHQPLLAGAASDANNEEGADTTGQLLHQSESEEERIRSMKKKHQFTLFSEIKVCLSSPVLVTLSLGWAAIIGVVASLGTFGASFTLALQLYDDERDAAYWFGIAAALAGVIGTPLGGRLADKILERYIGRRHTTDTTRGQHEGVEESLRYPIISSMLPRINTLVCLGMCFVFPTLAMQEAAFFLGKTFFCSFLFTLMYITFTHRFPTVFLFVGWTLLCK